MSIVITGTQRSGTTALRTVIARNGALDADEILHGTLNHEHRFFSFVADKIACDRALASPVLLLPMFDEFVRHLHNIANGDPVVMDLKYEHYNMMAARYSLFEPAIPYIIEYFATERTPIIHIMRRNKLRTLISRLIAEKTNVWGIPVGWPRSRDKRVSPQPDRVVMEIHEMERTEAKAREILSACPDVSELYYEETYLKDGSLSPRAIDVVSEKLGRAVNITKPDLIKQNPEPLCLLLDNYKEVADEIIGDGRFAWMLDEVT